jgi:hypothetical protein
VSGRCSEGRVVAGRWNAVAVVVVIGLVLRGESKWADRAS